MSAPPLVSIIVNNYNYARFLPQAIESALTQTYRTNEVIVVDDGSTDNSPAVLAHYAPRVKLVLKQNGGQGSAFNAGLQASQGAIILFLDADDLLLPQALERLVPCFDNPAVVKAHWRLRVIDEYGEPTGQLRPGDGLAEGDQRAVALRYGPTTHLSAPTSGNAWSRSLLEEIFPVPDLFRSGADTYLFEMAPFFGSICRLHEPLSLYRRHGQNSHLRMTLDVKLERQLRYYASCCDELHRRLEPQGIVMDLEQWQRHSWWHRLAHAVQAIASLPRAETPIIVADDGAWEVGPIGGRSRLPFLERNGEYYGSPPNDSAAISELERMRHSGAGHLAFGWPAFWWLKHYPQFYAYLRTSYPCVLENEHLVIFAL